MSGNGHAREVSKVADPVQDLDDVIRLIHFLGKSRPGGFTATLGWAEDKLRAVRETVAEHRLCGDFEADTASHRSHAEPFPLMSNLAVLCSEGNRA